MKSIKKNYDKEKYDNPKGYADEFLNEKEIGLLGNQCRFLVKLITAFQSEVY